MTSSIHHDGMYSDRLPASTLSHREPLPADRPRRTDDSHALAHTNEDQRIEPDTVRRAISRVQSSASLASYGTSPNDLTRSWTYDTASDHASLTS